MDLLVHENSEANTISVCVCVLGGGWRTDNAKAHSPRVEAVWLCCSKHTACRPFWEFSSSAAHVDTDVFFHWSDSIMKSHHRKKGSTYLFLYMMTMKRRESQVMSRVLFHVRKNNFFFGGGVIQTGERVLLCVLLYSALVRVRWSKPENHR